MGVGESIDFMKRKLTFMQIMKKLKAAVPVLVVLSLVVGTLNFGSYDPYNELSVLGTDLALAQEIAPAEVPEVAQPEVQAAANNFPFPDFDFPDFPALPASVVRTCEITTSVRVVNPGQSFEIYWNTEGFDTVTINGDAVATVDGSYSLAVEVNSTFQLVATTADGNSRCTASVTVQCVPVVVPPPTCTLQPAQRTVTRGDVLTLNWTTTNANTVTLTDFGAVATSSGSVTTGPITASRTYTLSVVGTDGSTVTCNSEVTVQDLPVASCDAFAATPSMLPIGGGNVTLNWQTSNAVAVSISPNIGVVAVDGSQVVAVSTNQTFTLTATDAQGNTVNCTVAVEVATNNPVVSCDSFTATPGTITRGAQSLLSWTTTNATRVVIDNGVGDVATPSGTFTVAPLDTITYTLTAFGVNNQQVSCTTQIVVATPSPISCEADVQFGASPTSIRRGDDSTLTWSTSARVTAVSFNQGITATGLSGSTSVSPEVDTEYVLTASVGTTTVACPVRVDVSSGGGGGGGSSSPRCELSVSDNRISRGDRVTLRWDSSRATNLVLEDVTSDDTLVTTLNLSTADKQDLFDGTLTVRPTKDTDYLLTVTRGSRERTCKVSVDVEGPSVLSEIRDQQPLVASIALTDVPYTGFEAGPILTFIFYALLMAWALYMAYLLVIRRDVIGGMKLATVSVNGLTPRMTQEQIRPDVFVNVRPPAIPASTLPTNLPVGTMPVVGYGATTDEVVVESDEEELVAMTEIENHAHKQHVLLSSDAVRHFMSTIKGEQVRIAELDKALAIAKTQYPSEDGWVVLNEKRMQTVCEQCQVVAAQAPRLVEIPTVLPAGSGSLAEAIVLGNVIAAYELIGNRAMFALADAAADLDAVYKIRRGMEARTSELLMTATASLTNDQILQMIQALTGALDGTYTDEASAVKMAIMKAIKVVA